MTSFPGVPAKAEQQAKAKRKDRVEKKHKNKEHNKRDTKPAKTRLENSDRQRTLEQCILIALVENLTSLGKVSNEEQIKTATGQLARAKVAKSKVDISKYQKILSAKQDLYSSQKRYHMSLSSDAAMPHLIGKYFVGPEIAPLFDIKPHELSSLVPKLRLYRVDINQKGEQTNAEEFYFSDHTDRDHVKDLLSGKADRFNEAGIQSVSWNLLGANPAEVKRYITVDIKILFSSIDALTKGPAREDAPAYTSLFARVTKGLHGQLAQKQGYYRLRLDVGWSVPENNKVFSGDRGKTLIRALEKTNKTFWLSLKNHDLNFKQDGSVELTISYFSSMEYELQRISVIDELRYVEHRGEQTIAEQRKKLAKLKKDVAFQVKCIKENPTPSKKIDMTNFVKQVATHFKSQEIRLKSFNIDVLSRIHKKLDSPPDGVWTKIKGSKTDTKWVRDSSKSLIKEIGIDGLAMGYAGTRTFGRTYWGWGEAGVTIDTYASQKGIDDDFTAALKIPPHKVASFHSSITEYLKDKLKAGESKNKKEFIKATTAVMLQLTTGRSEVKDISTIRYAFLGDIIDVTLSVCLEIYGKTDKNMSSFMKNTKIILGNIKVPRYKNGKRTFVSVPLSDIPISMNLFTAWFIKNIVDKGKTIYLLKDFLRDMLLQLVNASIGKECFKERNNHKYFPRNIPAIGFHTLRTGDKNYPFAPKDKRIKVITKDMLSSGRPYSEAPAGPDAKLTNYLLMYSRNLELEKKERISREDDAKMGIFSINIGSPRGIVKELTFSKVDSKHLEESLLTVKPTDMSLEVFRRIYNADIKLFGNTAFFPGQHIYIDPSTVGMGHPFENKGTKANYSAARLLGLGGYYLITKVDSEISPGNFSTNIKAQWVGFGDGTKGVSANNVSNKKGCQEINQKKLIKDLKETGFIYSIPKKRTLRKAYARGAAWLKLWLYGE